MGLPIARIGDSVFCPADTHLVPPLLGIPTPFPVMGVITQGSTKVFANNIAIARVGDKGTHAACPGPNTFKVDTGSNKVYDNNKRVARLSDQTEHCGADEGLPATGFIMLGSFTILSE